MGRRVLLLVITALVAAGVAPATAPPAAAAISTKVNFQSEGAPVPAGYLADFGEAFSTTRGYGWIEQSSSTPLSIVGNGRDRNALSDQRLDTLIHMQLVGTAPARWENTLPNGTYDVTVAVGDPSYTDSTHRLTVEGVVAIDNFVPTATATHQTRTVRVEVADGRLTLDAAGGTNTKLNYVDIVDVPAVTGKVNFQSESAPVPAGYVADFGEAFSTTRGYGWIEQSSPTPLSIVGNGRDRNALSDQRLDTFVHMQLTGGGPGVKTPARWEHTLPNGTYDVTVAVGDPSYTDSTHRLTVEGVVAINNFVPTATATHQTRTVRVEVTDGRLTLDAAGGTNTKLNYVDIASAPAGDAHVIVDVDPSNGEVGVPVTDSVVLSLSAPADVATINAQTVRVIGPTGAQVAGHYNSDAAGALVSFTPLARLSPGATYVVQTTAGLLGSDGAPFAPFTSEFTTGTGGIPPSPLAFDTVQVASVNAPTVVTLGPDGKLYVATGTGQILRYTLGADGVPTGTPQSIGPWSFQRTILGLAFDPRSTASAPILWVSHSELGFEDMPNFTGTISVLEGSNLGTVRDAIVGLPRSTRDHMTNGIVFGPDGRLYISQGSLTGFGAPDPYWGTRTESPLSAAILVADVMRDSRFTGTVNVDTSLGYDPKPTTAPVRLYATGTRNAYDLVWHSSGRLFAPVNESASGNAPADPSGAVPALENLPAGRDFLARIVSGGYYGHPNPSRGEYVLNGGNPTSNVDPWEQPQYPVGVVPPAAWQRPAYDFGLHRSADGVTEYTASAFGGALRGKLLIAEFSNGDDVISVGLDSAGNVTGVEQIAAGFNNPLDVTSDGASGNIYVAEYGSQPDGAGGGITLLRPASSTATPVALVNFQPPTAAVPTGYVSDSGEPFDGTRGRGWVEQSSSTPVSLVGNARERNLVPDQRLDTFIHMQMANSGTGVPASARWELAVASGTYDVTVAVGDPQYFDSIHRVTVEGVTAIAGFQPSSAQPFQTEQVRVNVTDGRITLDPAGGANTKLAYVDVYRVGGSGTDTTPPAVDASAAGPGTPPNFTGPVTVTVAASDVDSGLRSVTYTLDGGAAQPYTSPFTVSAAGSHTVVATATDNAGNVAADTLTFSIAGTGTPAGLIVESPHDFLGVGSRLVFSTVNEEVRPPRSVVLRNTGSSPLSVGGLTIVGPQAALFRLVNPPATPFSIPAGGTATVTVEFRPPSQQLVENYATLQISVGSGTATVALAGLDAKNYEGTNEPFLNELVRLLGYTTNIGGSATNASLTRDRLPIGDELISPYWVRVDKSKPAQLWPLANFSSRVSFSSLPTGWHAKGSTTKNQLWSIPGGTDISGGQNQRLMPQFNGTTSFTTDAVFGVYSGSDFSDDGKNGPAKVHNMRAYPAKAPSGAVIPNAWVIGYDIGSDVTSTAKNYDYQDGVFLLLNARPELPTANQPGTTPVTLDFGAARAGTVADRDGQGTGFTSVQANDAGNQYLPANIDLDANAGVLRLTSTSGVSSGGTNNQQNALEAAFDATRQDWRVNARLVGPFTHMTAAFQQQAIQFGPDKNNFLKFEIEYRSGKPNLVLYAEQNGAGTLPTPPVPIPATVAKVDLVLTGNPAAGTIAASYRFDSDAATELVPFGPAFAPGDVMRWFSTDARAVASVANEQTTTTFTATYDSFRVDPAPIPSTKTTWSSATAAPKNRHEAAGVSAGGKVYVLGGYVDGTFVPVNRADVLDTATGTWSTLPTLPEATSHGAAASDGRYVWLAGGYPPNGSGGQAFATANVWRLDTQTNTWSAMPSLPQARGSGGLVLIGRTLHFFGGSDSARADKADHWTLDADSGTAWQTAAPLPMARNHMGYTALNGRIYAIGGQTGQDSAAIVRNRVDVWDPALPGAWLRAADLPQGRSHISGGVTVNNGRIVVLGGETAFNVTTSGVVAFDPASNSWRATTSMPVSRSSGVAGSSGTALWYCTGNFTTSVHRGVFT